MELASSIHQSHLVNHDKIHNNNNNNLSIKIQIAPCPSTTMLNKPRKNGSKKISFLHAKLFSFIHQGQKGIPKLVLWLGMMKCLSLPSSSFKYPSHKKVLENLSSTTLSTSCTKTIGLSLAPRPRRHPRGIYCSHPPRCLRDPPGRRIHHDQVPLHLIEHAR